MPALAPARGVAAESGCLRPQVRECESCCRPQRTRRRVRAGEGLGGVVQRWTITYRSGGRGETATGVLTPARISRRCACSSETAGGPAVGKMLRPTVIYQTDD